MMIHQHAALFALLSAVFLARFTGAQQELRDLPEPQRERSLMFGWLFGTSHDDDADADNDRGFFSTVWCRIFSNCADDVTPENALNDLVEDILNTTDGSAPISDAINATEGSETPLRDFLSQLLHQPDSDTPVRDFIDEAFNRSDTPFLEFLSALFDTLTGTPVQNFVDDLMNGTTSPLQDALEDWFGDEIFADLNCSAAENAPPCAYNVDGDEGVWVCRTLFSPFDGNTTNMTHCAVPKYTFQNNDQCGSCDGTYPTLCTCTCTVDTAGDGVYITIDGGVEVQCVNAKWANNALNRFGVACAECA
jgi:hypothetical protein